jgi:hypothetical protein
MTMMSQEEQGLLSDSNDAGCSERTKPELRDEAGVEDVMFTAWCGRLIPKAFSPVLPPLVAEARKSSDEAAAAWTLTPSRLW